jgi:glutathione synthase
MSQPLKLAFILDPLVGLKAYKDSSIAMMRAAAARGHTVFAIGREALIWQAGAVAARALQLRLSDDNQAWYSPGEAAVTVLSDFDAVVMRQDPPFDPRAIRDHSEKIAITEFAQFTATTLVARDAADIQAFIEEIGDVVLKPLDGMGGSQIFRVRGDDPNRNVIIETLTHEGARTIMAQRYLPDIVEGDKRVLIIGGQVVPYALARIPKAGETRGNLAAGGRGVAMPLTEREREIAETLAPVLWARGLMVVGLDVIGGHLTEVNVTSPTCFVEIEAQRGFSVANLFIDKLEQACA